MLEQRLEELIKANNELQQSSYSQTGTNRELALKLRTAEEKAKQALEDLETIKSRHQTVVQDEVNPGFVFLCFCLHLTEMLQTHLRAEVQKLCAQLEAAHGQLQAEQAHYSERKTELERLQQQMAVCLTLLHTYFPYWLYADTTARKQAAAAAFYCFGANTAIKCQRNPQGQYGHSAPS